MAGSEGVAAEGGLKVDHSKKQPWSGPDRGECTGKSKVDPTMRGKAMGETADCPGGCNVTQGAGLGAQLTGPQVKCSRIRRQHTENFSGQKRRKKLNTKHTIILTRFLFLIVAPFWGPGDARGLWSGAC